MTTASVRRLLPACAACGLALVLSSGSRQLDAQNGGRAWAIVGAHIADGTGAPLRRGDMVAFVGDRIVSVGADEQQPGDTIVDAQGAGRRARVHRHPQSFAQRLANDPAAETQVAQGITTVVRGRRTASSPWPIGEFLGERRAKPAAMNIAAMVGHATVRRLVMSDDYKRAARPDEVARMAALVEQGMREGAVGLSSGLEYEVGGYAETGELVALATAAARHGGIYMSHIRDEADRAFDAFTEAIAIGERPTSRCRSRTSSSAPLACGARRRTRSALIESARKRGVDVTADAYPYNAWSSTITVSFPTSATTIHRASRRRSPTSAAPRMC